MKTVTRKNWHTHFDPEQKPSLIVSAGEEVRFETLDACYGEVHGLDELMGFWRRPSRGGDPITGPVFVEGARPGDTLVVDILSVDIKGPGFQLIGPDRAIVEKEIPDWTFYEVRVDGKTFSLGNGVRMPVNPVIGTFGNAPAGSRTNHPNPLGGNCDIPAVRAGTRLHIPIETPGALFSLGDVHACQGDGEVVGAPEISADVTVRFNLKEGRLSEWFMIEDAEEWHSACAADTEARAARIAVFQNARFISRIHGVELKDALILMSLVGKLTISRTGKWGDDLQPVVCSSFSKKAVELALKGLPGQGITRR